MRSRAQATVSRIVSIWTDRQVAASAAAIAFFAVLSLAPMLVFATAAATQWLGEEASRELTIERLQQFAGPESAELARSVLDSPSYDRFAKQSLLTSVPSAVLLLYGASGVFAQLRRALSQIFGKRASNRQVAIAWLIGRLIAAAGAIVGGLLFLVSLVVPLVLQTASGWLSETLGVGETIWSYASWATTLAVVFVVFLSLFAGLTRQRPPLHLLAIGAAASTIGFELGRWAFGAYVTHSFIATAYGPASSLVAFLLWMFYSANVVLFGAVVAQALRDRTTETTAD
ncbi:MAG: YihY/virulence factor BrkB family protein [Planctomycetota bacterium]